MAVSKIAALKAAALKVARKAEAVKYAKANPGQPKKTISKKSKKVSRLSSPPVVRL